MADDAAWVAGSAAVQQTANAINVAQTNKKQRQWAEKQYEKQKADNLAQWHLQNEYNAPDAQMQRLREAGLNPHLVYGKGADNISAPIASTSAQSYNPKAPELQGSPLSSYYNAKIQQAQYDNLRVQNTVQTQEALLKSADVAGRLITNARSKFDFDMASELKETSLEYAKEQLRKLQADTSFQLDENDRRMVTTDMGLQESLERILTNRSQRETQNLERDRLKAVIEQVKTSTEFQKLDVELKRNGINPNDPIYQRIIGRALNELLNGKSVYEFGKEMLKQYF